MAVELIKVSEFEESVDLKNWLVVADSEGISYKISIDNVKTQLGLSALMQYGGAVTPTDTPPAEGDFFWQAAEAGTYTNFNGIIVPANSLAIISRVGSVWSSSITTITPQDLSGLATKESVKEIDDSLTSLFSPDTDISKPLRTPNGYYRNSDGVYIEDPLYISSGLIRILPDDFIRRIGNGYASSAATGIAAFDSGGNYLGGMDSIAADYSFFVEDVFPGAYYLGFSSAVALGLTVNLKHALSSTVEANTNDIGLVVKSVDVFTGSLVGYINDSGFFVSALNWAATDFEGVIPDSVVRYTGDTSGAAAASSLWGYDSDNVPIVQLLNNGLYNDFAVTIPSNVFKVRASSKDTGVEVFSLIVKQISVPATVDIEVTDFMPEKTWAKQGELFKMNPFGILAKHPLDRSVDIIWNAQISNEIFFQYTPSVEETKSLILKTRDIYGNVVNVGTTDIQVTHTTQSPPVSRNIICLGDSLTQGLSNSIEGAYVNELSRRLTGVGTALLAGDESPAALDLSNIYFRGTLGDQPIKHEGRGGWGINHYLFNASVGVTTNAFWNPVTSEFDIDYYLEQNNFNAAQTTGGVNATGSNLTIVILLGWNHVYSNDVGQAKAWMIELIDIIKSKRSGVEIKLLGLPCPAYPNRKTYSGDRNVSVESIMRDAIITYSKAWQEICDTAGYSFVEFISVASVYFPLRSYPSISVPVSARDSTLIDLYTDYVHPNDRGYAQLADSVYYNILFNYCKAT